MYYELYSWKGLKGADWNFAVFYNTNRNKTVKEVFNKRTALKGMNSLRQRLSEMPGGSHVVWFDRLTVNGLRARGSEALEYPPPDIVAEVMSYARSRGIEVVGPPPVSPPHN